MISQRYWPERCSAHEGYELFVEGGVPGGELCGVEEAVGQGGIPGSLEAGEDGD